MRRWAAAALVVASAATGCAREAGSGGAETPAAETAEARIARGALLAVQTGCHDCHTPKRMGPAGPEPDLTRALIGHPESETLPPPPADAGPWNVHTTSGLTAWRGPWGTSYSANLTPDPETGTGRYTERMFVDAMRNGKQFGMGRPLLPPMPWQAIGKLSDDQLGALFAYLRSLPPVKNRVPDPVLAAPAGAGAPGPGSPAAAPSGAS